MKIIESDYNTFLSYNGLLSANTTYGTSLKKGIAKYYIVNNNNNFYTDFVLFDDNKISLDLFDNKELINSILDKIEYISCSVLNDKFIKDNYKIISYEEELVNKLIIKKIKFTKKEN